MLQISWKMRGSNSKKCQLRAPNWCKLQGKWTEQQIQQKIPKRKNNNSQNNSWPLPYTFIHVHTHPYISIHIHIYNLYIYIDPQISMHIHRYPYIHTSIPPYIHGCMPACMHAHSWYIYIYMYVYKHLPRCVHWKSPQKRSLSRGLWGILEEMEAVVSEIGKMKWCTRRGLWVIVVGILWPGSTWLKNGSQYEFNHFEP